MLLMHQQPAGRRQACPPTASRPGVWMAASRRRTACGPQALHYLGGSGSTADDSFRDSLLPSCRQAADCQARDREQRGATKRSSAPAPSWADGLLVGAAVAMAGLLVGRAILSSACMLDRPGLHSGVSVRAATAVAAPSRAQPAGGTLPRSLLLSPNAAMLASVTAATAAMQAPGSSQASLLAPQTPVSAPGSMSLQAAAGRHYQQRQQRRLLIHLRYKLLQARTTGACMHAPTAPAVLQDAHPASHPALCTANQPAMH